MLVVSAGVVVAGFAILLTGWFWLDPLISLAINAVDRMGDLGSSARFARHVDGGRAVPHRSRRGAGVPCRPPGVAGVHDLHIWSMSTTEVALTCHLIMPGGHPGDAFLQGLSEELARRFQITHPTTQIETDPNATCALAPDDVV